jgi:hypothetical protein
MRYFLPDFSVIAEKPFGRVKETISKVKAKSKVIPVQAVETLRVARI